MKSHLPPLKVPVKSKHDHGVERPRWTKPAPYVRYICPRCGHSHSGGLTAAAARARAGKRAARVQGRRRRAAPTTPGIKPTTPGPRALPPPARRRESTRKAHLNARSPRSGVCLFFAFGFVCLSCLVLLLLARWSSPPCSVYPALPSFALRHVGDMLPTPGGGTVFRPALLPSRDRGYISSKNHFSPLAAI